jgi:hypothetical protein
VTWGTRKRELPAAYVRMVENALTILRAGKLTSRRLFQLVDGDLDLLRTISERAELPGNLDEVRQIRALAGSALLEGLTSGAALPVPDDIHPDSPHAWAIRVTSAGDNLEAKDIYNEAVEQLTLTYGSSARAVFDMAMRSRLRQFKVLLGPK